MSSAGFSTAAPDWPMYYNGVRTLTAPRLPEGYEKATPEQREAMREAVRHLIRNEALFCEAAEFLLLEGYREKGDLYRYKSDEFLARLPRQFAAAYSTMIDEIEEVKKMQASYYDDAVTKRTALPESWAVLDAICREEFGFSIEEQCSLLQARVWRIYEGRDELLDYCISLSPEAMRLKGEREKYDRETDKERYDELTGKMALALYDVILAPNDYKGEAGPELREKLMGWYGEEFMTRARAAKGVYVPTVAVPPDLPEGLGKLARMEKMVADMFFKEKARVESIIAAGPHRRVGNDSLQRDREWMEKAQMKTGLLAVRLVGISKYEYVERMMAVLDNEALKRYAKAEGIEGNVYFYIEDEGLLESMREDVLDEWTREGLSEMPLPYAGPKGLNYVDYAPRSDVRDSHEHVRALSEFVNREAVKRLAEKQGVDLEDVDVEKNREAFEKARHDVAMSWREKGNWPVRVVP